MKQVPVDRLESQGWIASQWGESENNRRAKYYRLTASGRKALQAQTEYRDGISDAIEAVLLATREGA